MNRIYFGDVVIDLDSVIAVSEVKRDHKEYYFEVHLTGSKINVPCSKDGSDRELFVEKLNISV